MSIPAVILTCRHNDFTWIRCEGKGSFLNSDHLKQCAETEMSDGVVHIIIDLSQCQGMDSTFMGTMAGIAMKLKKINGGQIEVARPGDKNRKSLEDLGLSAMMSIDPVAPNWQSELEIIEGKLRPFDSNPPEAAEAKDVLEAHQMLCEADEQNTDKFAVVLDFLEAEVRSKKTS